MKVELGAPVVLRLEQPDLWHIPAAAKRTLSHVDVSIDDALERLSATWPALCDGSAGEVFVYGGFVRRRRLCRGCAFVNRQAPLEVPPSERDAIAAYDRRRARARARPGSRMTALAEVPVEQVRIGDRIHVSRKLGPRRVAEILEYDTLGLEQVDCFVVLYDAPGPGMAWENRAAKRRRHLLPTRRRRPPPLPPRRARPARAATPHRKEHVMQDVMQQVEIPRAEARESYLDYRRAAQRENDPVIRQELEAMARAFRIAAKEELPLIALTPTLTRGGTVPRTLVTSRGTEHERRTHYLLPRLAVCNAAARFVFTLGIERDGAIRFIDSLGRSPRYQRGRLELETKFELPEGYRAGTQVVWDRQAWSALVPIVPPKHRPARGALENLVVLWEVDDWTWRSVPAPPGDPALLQHVGGDLYAVLATWDLSPLEQLVLTGRRLEEAIV